MHPKLEERLVSFDALAQEPMAAADDAFRALGATMRQAGSKEAFYAVDHDAVVNFAYWARSGGAAAVARAIVQAAQIPAKGSRIHHYAEIRSLAATG